MTNKYVRQIWTDKDVDNLKKLYPTSTKEELIKFFPGRPVRKIYSKASSIGLKKCKEVISRQSKESWENRADNPAIKYQFKKGRKPFNKGMKQADYMTKEGIKKSALTRFKKGNRPKNWRPVGSTRLDDGYLMIKTKEPDVYELQHRVLWESHYGPIPKGCNIQFKDGDKTNIVIDNLYKISKSEQMIENNGAINLPDNQIAMYLSGGKNSTKEGRGIMLEVPELIELKRNQILLNRQIKKNEKS